MTSTLRSLSKIFCAGLVCATLAGCAVTPTDNQATSDNATTDASAESKTTEFVNAKDHLNDTLKANYVDFSFKFPDDWEAKEGGSRLDAKNFVKLERSVNKKTDGEFTQENFAVGYLKTTGDSKQDSALFPQIAKQLSAELQKGFANYKKISEGPTKINNLNGYEFRFQSTEKTTKKEDVTLWGRVVLLPKPNSKQGVSLVMMASSHSPEIKSAADLGVKGQLPVILKSFTFEKKQPEKNE
jgi:membrane-bound lytic murein transglycosylase